MTYKVLVYEQTNQSLLYSNEYSSYDGAIQKAKQWLGDKYRSKKYKIIIEEK